MMKHIAVALFLLLFSTPGKTQDKIFKTYYPGGKLRSIKHEGIFNGCNMPVGTDSLFYQSGELMSTIFYNNIKGKSGGGCHDTWTIASTVSFYKNGNIQQSSQQKYSYEGTPCNCGVWERKNIKGELADKKTLGDCYDQKPCENP